MGQASFFAEASSGYEADILLYREQESWMRPTAEVGAYH
jgi:hypothetical protein